MKHLRESGKMVCMEMCNQGMKVAVVIPAYNEAQIIGRVVRKAKEYIDNVIVVDDGSEDETALVAEQSGARVVRHSVNLGIGAAQQSGYNAAMSDGADYIVQIDADGQHDPKYIPQMLEAAREYDIVIGSRFLNSCHRSYPLARRLGIPFFSMVVRCLGRVQVTDVTSGYRVYRCEALRRLSPLPKRHWALEQTMEAAKKGLKIKEVSVEMPVRNNGKSQFCLITYGLYPFRMAWVVVKVLLFK